MSDKPPILRHLVRRSHKLDPGANTNLFSYESGLTPAGPVVEAVLDSEISAAMEGYGYSCSARTSDGPSGSQVLLTFKAEEEGRLPKLFALSESNPRDGTPRILSFRVQQEDPPESIRQAMVGDRFDRWVTLQAPLKPYVTGWMITGVIRNNALVFLCTDAPDK